MTRDQWRSPSFVLLAPLLLLTALYLDKQAVGPDYYGVARVAQAASAVGIIVPICAGLAAWEGSRLQRARIAELAPVRREAAIALRALTPVLLVAGLGIACAALLMLSSTPSLRLSDFRVLFVPLAVVAGHVSLAYAAGRMLPAVFAVPGAVLASWLWIVYPISIEPLWIRHLTGYLLDCCDTSTVPATGALVAPIVIGLAGCVAAAVLLGLRSRGVGIGLAVVALGGALAVGVSMVSDLGSEPSTPRSRADLACRGAAPRVCLWPEHTSAHRLVGRRARAVSAHLRRAGIATPTVVSEGEGRWLIGVVPGVAREAVDATLIEGLLPGFPRCAKGPARYPGIKAYWPMALWLAQTGGASTEALRYSTTSSDRSEVAAVRRAPKAHQLNWYRRNVRALSTCGVEPQLLTSQ